MSIIVDDQQLKRLTGEIDKLGRFAVDLEFIPERSYRPKLCLVQIATDQSQYIVDPLELPDLSTIWARVADPNIQVVLHAADQDLALIHAISGLVPQNLMDTQIAAGFAGYGYPVSYSNLLLRILGVRIPKTESFTDWKRRPLTESQVDYALSDVQHILPMFDRLATILKASGRYQWAERECSKYCLSKAYLPDREQLHLKVKGASSLTRRGLAVLQSLLEWRDTQASTIDKPPRAIIADNIILELSRRPPARVSDIERIRSIRPDQIKQHGRAILEAVVRGLELPENQCPIWPEAKTPKKRDSLAVDILFSVLKITCYQLALAPELVATRAELERLVRHHREGKLDPDAHALLTGWQYEIVGRKILNLLDGAELSIRLRHEEPPVQMQIGSLNSSPESPDQSRQDQEIQP